MNEFEYKQLRSIKEVCKLLKENNKYTKVFAGGTDIFIQMNNGKIQPDCLIDIKNLNLSYIIRGENGTTRIGATTNLNMIIESNIIIENYICLSETAKDMAAVQVRNRATVGGNLCNASPSADMAPPLIAMDAYANISSYDNKRMISLSQFFVAPGKTDLKDGEILEEILLPPPSARSACVYLKQKRNAMDLATIGVAVNISLDNDEILNSIKIVLGAVGPTPINAYAAANFLIGQKINKKVIKEGAKIAAQEAKPITDIRASKEYRIYMTEALVEEAMLIAWDRIRQQH